MRAFDLPHGLKLGDWVLVTDPGPARGLGQLEDFERVKGTVFVRVRTGGRKLMLSEEAARRLERPLSRADAQTMMQSLAKTSAQPDEREEGDRYITSIKTVSKGTWKDIAERLAVLYASPWKPSFGEQRIIDMFETTLVPMLAHALGTDEPKVREELRAGKPVFAATKERPPSKPVRPAESFALAGWESLFRLELDGEIWIGERPDWFAERDNGLAHLKVQPGRWHSYRRFEEDDEDDEDDAVELLLVHESHLANVASAKWKAAAAITAVVGSGAVNVVDRTALANEDTMDRVRYLGGVNAYGGRALCVATQGWDGPLPVLVSPPAGPTTMVKVPLRDDDDALDVS